MPTPAVRAFSFRRLLGAATWLCGCLTLLQMATPDRAAAQGRVDRSPLDFRFHRRPAPVDDNGQPLDRVPSTLDTVFTWFLKPDAVLTDNADDYGLALGLTNGVLLGGIPLELSVTDHYVTSPTGNHNRVQFDGQLAFDSVGSRYVSLTFQGRYRNTSKVTTSQQAMAELDFYLFKNKNAGTSLSIGGVGYYGHEKPDAAPGSSGATFGVASALTPIANLDLVGEYDFKSDFSGEDDYSFQVKYLFEPKGLLGLAAIAGYGKHNVWEFGLKAGFVGSTRRRQP